MTLASTHQDLLLLMTQNASSCRRGLTFSMFYGNRSSYVKIWIPWILQIFMGCHPLFPNWYNPPKIYWIFFGVSQVRVGRDSDFELNSMLALMEPEFNLEQPFLDHVSCSRWTSGVLFPLIYHVPLVDVADLPVIEFNFCLWWRYLLFILLSAHLMDWLGGLQNSFSTFINLWVSFWC